MAKKKITFDVAFDICNNASNSTLNRTELTFGSGGYPEFRGIQRFAFFGFDNFEEAQTLALECKGTIQEIHWKDGWVLAESVGNAHTELIISSDDYGDDYREWDFENEKDALIDFVKGADDFEEIKAEMKKFIECGEEYASKADDERIISREGSYYETIKLNPMEWEHDTHHTAIAVVISSKDY